VGLNEEYGLPNPLGCQRESDLGNLHYDLSTGIWYECFFDGYHASFTWSALPPDDAD
jgi:hypothetical protein